jgi:excisionase family DNA binding protein
MTEENSSTAQCLSQTRATGDSRRRTRSVPEAGKVLGISRGAAYAAAKAGTLPTIRIGKRILVPNDALEKLLAST